MKSTTRILRWLAWAQSRAHITTKRFSASAT